MRGISLLLAGLFVFASSAHAETILNVDDQANGFQGSMQKYSKTGIFMDDAAEATVSFTVVAYEDHLTTARRVARYMWSVLWPTTRTKAPFPCGVYATGEITTQKGEDQDGNSTYRMTGYGDGGGNTCTGNAYPGAWSSEIEVTYNKESKEGTATYRFYFE